RLRELPPLRFPWAAPLPRAAGGSGDGPDERKSLPLLRVHEPRPAGFGPARAGAGPLERTGGSAIRAEALLRALRRTGVTSPGRERAPLARPRRGQDLSACRAAITFSGCAAASETLGQCLRTFPSGPIQTVERMTPIVFFPYEVFSP